jgi:hypothetical protein
MTMFLKMHHKIEGTILIDPDMRAIFDDIFDDASSVTDEAVIRIEGVLDHPHFQLKQLSQKQDESLEGYYHRSCMVFQRLCGRDSFGSDTEGVLALTPVELILLELTIEAFGNGLHDKRLQHEVSSLTVGMIVRLYGQRFALCVPRLGS